MRRRDEESRFSGVFSILHTPCCRRRRWNLSFLGCSTQASFSQMPAKVLSFVMGSPRTLPLLDDDEPLFRLKLRNLVFFGSNHCHDCPDFASRGQSRHEIERGHDPTFNRDVYNWTCWPHIVYSKLAKFPKHTFRLRSDKSAHPALWWRSLTSHSVEGRYIARYLRSIPCCSYSGRAPDLCSNVGL